MGSLQPEERLKSPQPPRQSALPVAPHGPAHSANTPGARDPSPAREAEPHRQRPHLVLIKDRTRVHVETAQGRTGPQDVQTLRTALTLNREPWTGPNNSMGVCESINVPALLQFLFHLDSRRGRELFFFIIIISILQEKIGPEAQRLTQRHWKQVEQSNQIQGYL